MDTETLFWILAAGAATGIAGLWLLLMPQLGVPIALAIGIQNIPEGFAAGAPLYPAGASRKTAALVAAATGAVEPPSALAAFAAFGLASGLLPFGLAFAAGEML